ncbi:MAG: aminoglycoside phosphotransferase family protein, partial [Aeromicrobium sp.]
MQVVVAHHDCATLRVDEVFLKIDADQTRTDVEVEAMRRAPIPTPEVLWRKPPVLALAALPGTALGRLDQTASQLDRECTWLLTNDVLPSDLVTRNRRLAETALRPWTPRFTHGDLQVAHVFVDGDEITG